MPPLLAETKTTDLFIRKVNDMISANNISLRVGKKALFEDVNIKFTEGNCYGLIGANGAGKSTFLKILSGQLEPTSGEVAITPGQRLSFLQQDHFKYDEYTVLDTVIMGNARLYQIMKEKEAIYMKEDFTDEDGIKAAELEGEFATMNGWEAESDAENLLNGLGIGTEFHYAQMSTLLGAQKVKVLLAQALFGNPDILLLDEPTNHLDLDAIAWLEEFLINFENTVIVVSHDRYFLNKVCTQIADIDYGKIQLYAGNYDFWVESSQLIIKQMKEANRKKEEKIKELQEFIQRFSANASKSKQATSRKRALEKIQLDDIKPSSRKYPYIDFRPAREIGNEVLTVEHLSKTIDGEKILDDISFILGREDKVALVGPNERAKTVLFKILAGEMAPDEGSYKWGLTTTQSYFPKDNSAEFANDDTIVEWLTQYSPEKDVTYVRGFLGRMLFAGEDGVKKVKVLSGGEKVRCMLSKLMISGANVLMLDEPTDHLDMESIDALNRGMIKFPGVMIFSSRDHQIVQTTANRIMEIINGKLIDKITTYDEYLESDEMARKRFTFTVTESDEEDD
jgi:ATPase subunit of ABC transporter with duplicated ATPase domains